MEEKKFKLIVLSVKMAIFFAKVDNNYDEKEKKFINDYIKNKEKDLNPEEITILRNLESSKITISEIINETENFLSMHPQKDHKPLLHTFMHLIDMVILLDNNIHPEEEKAFNVWKNHFDVK